MIKGLMVTVAGVELQKLCLANAERLRRKAKEALKLMAVCGEQSEMSYGANDAKSSADRAESQAQEMEFVAAHLVPNETYELSTNDLARVGVIDSRF